MIRRRELLFGPFRLDPTDERLWRANEPIRLGHKAFALLRRLLRDPGRLVTKDELLDAAWAGTAVGEAVLTTAVRELRRALGDRARSPRFIETVHGRGYRFVARVHEAEASRSVPGSGPSETPDSREPESPLVGRDAESARLRELWAEAGGGQRRVAFVGGEAGIGKTFLVESFVAGIVGEGARIGHGRCIEHYGAGEPYLPLLEALGRLGRDDPALVETLRRHAPSWLTHLPGLPSNQDPSGSTPAPQRVTPERMLREIAEALEVVTAGDPLVLVLEDLHWSDVSTLEWLSYVARRPDPARLLVVGTYRPVETVLHDHPLRGLVAELRRHPHCDEIVLDYLPAPAITDYVRKRRPDAPELHELVDALVARTGGHPLLLVTVVDELVRREVPASDLEAVTGLIPASVRHFLEHRFELLPEEDRSLLERASVAGSFFTVAAVAASTPTPEDAIEDRLAAWSRHGRFVAPAGTETWPDGTTTTRYRFLHDLFHEVLYARIPPARRSRLHREIGRRLEAGFGGEAPGIAVRLATHFEEGRDPRNAIVYLERAARNALERSAYREARAHLERGRFLVERLPADRNRAELELKLCLLLGQSLGMSEGWGSVEAEQAYARARHLCEPLEDRRPLLLVLWGLISVNLVRARLRETRILAEELLVHAQRLEDPVFELAAHMELGGVAFELGEPTAAAKELQRTHEMYDPRDHAAHVDRIGIDVGILSRSWETHVLWHLGLVDQACEQSEEVLRLAGAVGHPFERTIALTYAATLRQFLRDEEGVVALADAAIAIAGEQEFPYYLAWARILRGWRRCTGDGEPGGVGEIHDGLEVLRTVGGVRLSYFQFLLAEALAATGRHEEALAATEAGLREVKRTSERWWEPELHRLKGELLRATFPSRAEASFRRALEGARRQQAKSLELRAVTSLSRLCRDQDRRTEGLGFLSAVLDGFPEGSGSADVHEARHLRDELQY